MSAVSARLLDRYIFKTVLTWTVALLVGLTSVIWITQALRQVDLVTGKGQTVLIFLTVTLFSLPALIAGIAPVALFAATLYTLNKLNGDSELIVMNASGIAPVRVLRPFAFMALLTTLLVAWMSVSVIPASFRSLRDIITKIRADFVSNIVKEGQFATLDIGITFHYREKSGDTLLGIFLQDRREEGKTSIYIAERGQTAEVEGSSFLILEKGSIQRQSPGALDSSIVAFDRYAVNLSLLGGSEDEGSGDGGGVIYKPRERVTADLLAPERGSAYYQAQAGRFRAELHNRLSSPLYPIAFMLIAFATMGQARTTRQGRGAAIQTAVILVSLVRLAGYAAWSASVRTTLAVPIMYALPLLASLLSMMVILQGHRLRPLLAPYADRLVSRVGALIPQFGKA
jgi:lipopolysaccharide export system permease protein